MLSHFRQRSKNVGERVLLLSYAATRIAQPFYVSKGVHINWETSKTVDDTTAQAPTIFKVTQTVYRKQVTLSVQGQDSKDYKLQRVWSEGSGTKSEGDEKLRSSVIRSSVRRFQATLAATFLPTGYPTDVGPNYLQFSAWQFATNVFTITNAALASAFLLYSVGVGSGVVATARALNWILKDGIGQLGALVCGKQISHNFDVHAKTWFFLSCLLLSIATGIEIMTIMFPTYFLYMGAFAVTVKGISWMAGGATRSVFYLNFVRDNNLADINAKGTSQYIFATICGLSLGSGLALIIGKDFHAAMTCCLTLAALTQYSAYRSVKATPLSSLNSDRLQMLSESFLVAMRKPVPAHTSAKFYNYQRLYDDEFHDSIEPKIPTPVQLASDDLPFARLMGDQRLVNPRIDIGSRLDVITGGKPSVLVMLGTTFRYSRYIILPKTDFIHCIFHQEADAKDIMQAFLHAAMLRMRMRDGMEFGPHRNLAELRVTLQDTLLPAKRLTTPFINVLSEHGWQVDRVCVETRKQRAVW